MRKCRTYEIEYTDGERKFTTVCQGLSAMDASRDLKDSLSLFEGADVTFSLTGNVTFKGWSPDYRGDYADTLEKLKSPLDERLTLDKRDHPNVEIFPTKARRATRMEAEILRQELKA